MHPQVQPALTGAPELSIVLPCYNEEGSLPPLLDEIEAAMSRVGRPFEVLAVDDKSTDRTLEVLLGLQRRHAALRVLRHEMNCGESAAFATGFARVRGEIVITMDSDQQNDPADIPAMLAALEGVDLVCGVRAKRRDTWVKRASSKVANRFRDAVTGVPVTDAGCTFRAIRRAVLAELPVFNGMHRFLPTMLRLQGFAVREIPVNHRPRSAGRSNYGIGNRAWRGLVDCFAMRWFRRRVVPGRRTLPEAAPPGARP